MGRNGLQERMRVRVSKEWRAGASLGSTGWGSGVLVNSHGQRSWYGVLSSQPGRLTFPNHHAGEREMSGTGKVVWECGYLGIQGWIQDNLWRSSINDCSRDLQGSGVCKQWVSSLIKQLGWPQQGVCTPEKQLSIFGPAELALLVIRILKEGTWALWVWCQSLHYLLLAFVEN